MNQKKNTSVIFVGSTIAGKEILKAMLAYKANIVGIVSLDDSYKKSVSGFANYEDIANRHKIPLLKVKRSINDKENIDFVKQIKPDFIFIMAWPQILSREIVDIPNIGCIGRHNALLPERRGCAPVAWALIDGLEKSGVTLFWMDERIDHGDILAQKSFKIDFEDTAQDVLDKITETTKELIKETLTKFSRGVYVREPQDHTKVTYTHRRTPDMGLIDWGKNALRLYNFIRGITHPYPGAFTFHKLKRITLWQAKIGKWSGHFGVPGQILKEFGNNNYEVQTGDGTLIIRSENSLKVGDVLK